MTAILQTWRLEAPACPPSAEGAHSGQKPLGPLAPPGMTLPGSDLVLDPRHPDVTDTASFMPSAHASAQAWKVAAGYALLPEDLEDTEEDWVLAGATRQQLTILLGATYLELKRPSVHNGNIRVELTAPLEGRRGAVLTAWREVDPARQSEGPELLASHGLPASDLRLDGSAIAAVVDSAWFSAVGMAAQAVADRFIAQIRVAAPKSWGPAPALNTRGILALMHFTPEMEELQRLGSPACLRLKTVNVGAWKRHLTATLNPAVALTVQRNFARPTWADYCAAMQHQAAITAAHKSYGGLAPLHYPPAFFSSPVFVEQAQHGLLATIAGSPAAMAMLHKQPLRYLVRILEQFGLELSVADEITAPDVALGTLAGLVLGGVFVACAELRAPFLPGLRDFKATVPSLLLATAGAYKKLAGTLARGSDRPALMRLLAPVVAEFCGKYRGRHAVAMLPRRMHARGMPEFHAEEWPSGLSGPDASEEVLAGLVRHRLAYPFRLEQVAAYTACATRILHKTMSPFVFNGERYLVEPYRLPVSSRELTFVLRSSSTGPVEAQLNVVRDPVRRAGSPIQGYYISDRLAPSLGGLCAAFNQYLDDYHHRYPVIAALTLLRGDSFVETAIRNGPPLSTPYAATLLTLAAPLQWRGVIEAILDRTRNPQGISRSRSKLDVVADALSNAEAPQEHAVYHVARHLQRAGAPPALFQRALDSLLAKHEPLAVGALLLLDIPMTPEQEAAFLCWHPERRPIALQAQVQAARMRWEIQRARERAPSPAVLPCPAPPGAPLPNRPLQLDVL